LQVHFLVENAGSMVDVHRACIRRFLGLPEYARFDPMIDAGRWTAFLRRRIYFSTLPWEEPAT
ncbi:MAG: hypothetical protein ACKPKO_38670, partial [Candidatus Fonsibacter sp.]